MDGDCAGHGSGRAVLGASRLVAAFTRVVFLLDQVVAGAEGDQMCVVSRRRDRDGASAAHVRVTELVGEALQLVGPEVVVVPQDVVVGRTGCTLLMIEVLIIVVINRVV